MDLIPVLEPSFMAPVKFHRALRLIADGQCAVVRGPDGKEIGLRWLFSGLDAAIASDKGNGAYASSHSVAGKVRIEVSEWDGNDPFEGCSAVMLRGISGRAASFF